MRANSQDVFLLLPASHFRPGIQFGAGNRAHYLYQLVGRPKIIRFPFNQYALPVRQNHTVTDPFDFIQAVSGGNLFYFGDISVTGAITSKLFAVLEHSYDY